MDTLVANTFNSASPRKVSENGRQYLVVPATSIISGVLPGSKGALYYPEDEINRNVEHWNGKPLVVYHPFGINGEHVSASHPGVVDRQGVGEIRNTVYRQGKLRHELWFDIDRVRNVRPDLLPSLHNGRKIELSTGLFTDNELAPNGSNHNGKSYTHIARNYRPDHLAILPDQVGACSIQDGCGVFNREQLVLNYRQWISSAVENANPEGCNQYKQCGSSERTEAQQASGEIKGKDTKTKKSTDDRLKAQAIVDAAYGRHMKRVSSEPDASKRAASYEQHKQEIKDAGVVPIKGGYSMKGKGSQNPRTYKESTANAQLRHIDSGQFLPDQGRPATKQTTAAAIKGFNDMGMHQSEECEEDEDSEECEDTRNCNDTMRDASMNAGNAPPAFGQGNTPNPHMASKMAASASLHAEHPEARDHAIAAMDSSGGGSSEDAISSHNKAAKTHDKAAVGALKEGDQDGADSHLAAASLHRRAAAMHTASPLPSLEQQTTTNTEEAMFEFNGSASGVTESGEVDNYNFHGCNRYTGPGCGGGGMKGKKNVSHTEKKSATEAAMKSSSKAIASGSAEDHDTAAAAHYKAAAVHRKAGDMKTAAKHSKAGDAHSDKGGAIDLHSGHDIGGGIELAKNRLLIQNLAGIVENCSCQATKNRLKTMLGNAMAEGSNASATGSGSDQAGGEEDTDEDKNDEEWEDDVNIRKKGLATNQGLDQWMATAPPVVREAVQNAMHVTNETKYAMVMQLIANVQNPQRRNVLGNELMEESIGQLKKRLEMMGPQRQQRSPAYNFDQSNPGYLPNFLGSGNPLANQGMTHNDAEPDILELPTMNWEQIAEENSREERMQVRA